MREFGNGEEYFSPLYESSQLDHNYSLTFSKVDFFGPSLQTSTPPFSSILSPLSLFTSLFNVLRRVMTNSLFLSQF
jgi:hypothetical protein